MENHNTEQESCFTNKHPHVIRYKKWHDLKHYQIASQ
jgi:hypothetical protein